MISQFGLSQTILMATLVKLGEKNSPERIQSLRIFSLLQRKHNDVVTRILGCPYSGHIVLVFQ